MILEMNRVVNQVFPFSLGFYEATADLDNCTHKCIYLEDFIIDMIEIFRSKLDTYFLHSRVYRLSSQFYLQRSLYKHMRESFELILLNNCILMNKETVVAF